MATHVVVFQSAIFCSQFTQVTGPLLRAKVKAKTVKGRFRKAQIRTIVFRGYITYGLVVVVF